jgi:glucan phosphoethanolaminetransferase (alkaline phosphatase superfamily)
VLASRRGDPERVVIVFVDTLRRDHLGVYGYERNTSPALDHLARDAIVFDDARAISPWTLPSTP